MGPTSFACGPQVDTQGSEGMGQGAGMRGYFGGGRIYAGCVKPLPADDLEHVLSHTRSLWEEARGQEIFVSGGTGFFGAWLLESLAHCNRRLDLGLCATILSRDPEAFVRRMPHLAGEPCIRLHQGNVRDFAFPERGCRFVIHAASPTVADLAGKPLDLLATHVDGTRRMVELARVAGAKKFLFTSSGAVYGRQPEALSHISEDYLGGPDWLDANAVYGEGKRVSEQICALFAQESGIACVIARCFAFAGPHLPLDQHFAIGNFIGDALAGRNIAVRGDGTPMRSYLYGADLAIWLWTMLFRGPGEGAQVEAYNVGSGEAISIRELAHVVVEELNPSLKVEVAQEPVAGVARLQYVPDVQKAEKCMGLRQSIGLREAVRRTAAWHRQ